MASVPKKRKPVQRTMQFIKTGMVNLLWITQGKKTDGYQVEDTSAFNNADAPTFRLTKTDGTIYSVLLDGPASLCDCKGFERFGMQTKDKLGCKHVAALTKLHQLGKI
jgi:SWIM zinc finger